MYIILEISPQFHGDEKVAEQMILQSKMAGADAVKVQLYDGVQFGTERAYLSMKYDQLERLKKFADSLNIPLFATPFTFDRLEWCMKLELPFLKVAARMHEQFPELTAEILKQKVPTFVSIPAETDPDTIEKFDHAKYLYCVVKYPTRVDEIELPDFENSCFEGLSDHTLGNSGALYAAAHGCQILEKHFTLRHSFQFETEKAHLGAMTAEDLTMIKNTAREFETIRRKLNH